MLFAGLHERLERDPPGTRGVARAAVAACTCALVLHTLIYASFLEDPLLWTLLALAAALRIRRPAPQPSSATARMAATSSALPAPLSTNASGVSGSASSPSSDT
jgi:hypothetical protein